MPAIFVHGNPETTEIWDPLVKSLARDDVMCLSPPGFGAPATKTFGATREDYREWLIAELEGVGAAVDLVGHDWGGGHVIAVAIARPDLLRTWCSDIAGVLDPEYVWHDFAQTWQTPGEGEAAVESLAAMSLEERTDFLASAGVPGAMAQRLAAAYDETMGRCILALYRSAAQPAMAELGRELRAAASRPGLVLIPTEDHYVGTEAMARRSAARAGAQVEVLEGLAHWWMLEDPARGARILEHFWSTAGVGA